MTEFKQRFEYADGDLTFSETELPNEKNVSTGKFTVGLHHKAVTGKNMMVGTSLKKPDFIIEVIIDFEAMKIVIKLGPFYGTAPLSGSIMSIPPDIRPVEEHRICISYVNWRVLSVTFDGEALKESKLETSILTHSWLDDMNRQDGLMLPENIEDPDPNDLLGFIGKVFDIEHNSNILAAVAWNYYQQKGRGVTVIILDESNLSQVKFNYIDIDAINKMPSPATTLSMVREYDPTTQLVISVIMPVPGKELGGPITIANISEGSLTPPMAAKELNVSGMMQKRMMD